MEIGVFSEHLPASSLLQIAVTKVNIACMEQDTFGQLGIRGGTFRIKDAFSLAAGVEAGGSWVVWK